MTSPRGWHLCILLFRFPSNHCQRELSVFVFHIWITGKQTMSLLKYCFLCPTISCWSHPMFSFHSYKTKPPHTLTHSYHYSSILPSHSYKVAGPYWNPVWLITHPFPIIVTMVSQQGRRTWGGCWLAFNVYLNGWDSCSLYVSLSWHYTVKCQNTSKYY